MEDKSKSVPKTKKRKEDVEAQRDVTGAEAEADHDDDIDRVDKHKKKKKAKKNKKERSRPREPTQTLSKGKASPSLMIQKLQNAKYCMGPYLAFILRSPGSPQTNIPWCSPIPEHPEIRSEWRWSTLSHRYERFFPYLTSILFTFTYTPQLFSIKCVA